MKRILLLGLLLLGSIGVHAQQISCAEAASNAVNILASAQTLLDQENIEGAQTLITSASSSLENCQDTDIPIAETTSTPATSDSQASTVSQPTTVPVETATLEPTATPTEVLPTLMPQVAIYDGNYSVNPPTLTADDSIAFLHFAHTSVYTGAIDLYMEDDQFPIVGNLSYGEVTDMIWIRGGNRTVIARAAGSGVNGDVLDQLTWNFASNSTWVTAAIEKEAPDFLLEPISILRNDYNGQARVRVVNLIPNTPNLVVEDATGRVYADSLRWRSFRDTSVSEGTYNLTILTDDSSIIIPAQEISFTTRTTTTLLAIGDRTTDHPITFVQLIDDQEMTRVRFINDSASPIEIYQRPDNIKLVEVLDPGEETDYYTVDSGATTFTSYALGTGPIGRQLANLSWQLRPGRDMVISVQPATMVVQNTSLIINSEP